MKIFFDNAVTKFIASILILLISGVFVTFVWAGESAAFEKSGVILMPVNDVSIRIDTLRGHSGYVFSVSFSPDGRILASGSGDKSIIFWDMATGDKIKTLNGYSSVLSVSFSPDGRILASGNSGDNSIILWDVATGDEIKTLNGHSDFVFSVSFSPDGKILASVSEDKSIILWDVATGNKIKTLDGHFGVNYPLNRCSVSFSPDSKILASLWSGSEDKSIILWEVATGNQIKAIKGHFLNKVYSVTFSPDGKTLALGSFSDIILWDVATGDKIKTLDGHSGMVSLVSFSPDGKILASSGPKDESTILWDVSTGDKKNTFKRFSFFVSFSPDGKILASGSDKTVILWPRIYLPDVFKRDEFETTMEYEKRMKGWELPYSSNITLGKYDADKGGFDIDITGNKIFISIPREKAKDLISHKDEIYIEGKLIYFDPQNAQLVNALLVDRETNERFALQSDSLKSQTAQVSKPVIKENLQNKKSVNSPSSYILQPVVKESPVDNIHIIPDFKQVPRKNDLAIVIGIENYQSLPKSDYSKSDAVIMKDYLKALGFQERNMEFIIDERATLSGVVKSIEAWLPNRVKKDSKVFVYYSGHGAPEPSTGDAYLVPFDGDPTYLSVTGYPLKKLYDKLGQLQAAEVVVVLDSCFSGAGGRSVLAKGARPINLVNEGLVTSPNMVVISASQGSQISTSSPEKGHGIFTYYFLKAIKDGKKELAEIYEYITPLVEDEAKMLNVQQTPAINPDVEQLKGRFVLRK